MAELTCDKFLTALVVILLLAGAYNTIMTTVKTRREEKKLRDSPVTQLKERGDNNVWVDTGDTTLTYRQDDAILLSKLTAQVSALNPAVTNP